MRNVPSSLHPFSSRRPETNAYFGSRWGRIITKPFGGEPRRSTSSYRRHDNSLASPMPHPRPLVLAGASERVYRTEEEGAETRPRTFRRVHHSRLRTADPRLHLSSVHTRSAPRLARAGWERCTAPRIRGWTAASPRSPRWCSFPSHGEPQMYKCAYGLSANIYHNSRVPHRLAGPIWGDRNPIESCHHARSVRLLL
jgi:hypothetical protein